LVNHQSAQSEIGKNRFSVKGIGGQ